MRAVGLLGALAFSLAVYATAWAEVQPALHLFKRVTDALP
jgi:hypothetical protein